MGDWEDIIKSINNSEYKIYFYEYHSYIDPRLLSFSDKIFRQQDSVVLSDKHPF